MCAQLCPNLCDALDCSPPGSSVLGIFQARMLDQIDIFFSRGSYGPRDWTLISCISSTADRFFTTELRGKPKASILQLTKGKKKTLFFFNDISFGISWWLLNWQVSTWEESHRCGFRSQIGVFQQCGLEKVLRPLRAWLLMDKKGTIFQGSYGYGCSHLSQNYCDYNYFYL